MYSYRNLQPSHGFFGTEARNVETFRIHLVGSGTRTQGAWHGVGQIFPGQKTLGYAVAQVSLWCWENLKCSKDVFKLRIFFVLDLEICCFFGNDLAFEDDEVDS